MHSVVWASVLASAGVAAIITLIIEYAAKPRLDARKDRILDNGREVRLAIKNFNRAVSILGVIAACIEDNNQTAEFEDLAFKNAKEAFELMFEARMILNVPRSIERDWGEILPLVNAPLLILARDSFPLDYQQWSTYLGYYMRLYRYAELFATSRIYLLKRRAIIKMIKAPLTTDE